MTRLSIIVPMLPGDDVCFEDTLAAVLRNQPGQSEILAVHDGSYLDPHNLREVGVRIVQVRAAQHWTDLISAALGHCRGDVVHILRPGTLVDEGWIGDALDSFADPRIACAAPLLVSEPSPHHLLTWGLGVGGGGCPRLIGEGRRHESLMVNRDLPLGPSLWAAFYRRDPLLSFLRRFAGRTTRLLDLEIALAFRAIGLSCAPLMSALVMLADPNRFLDEHLQASGGDAQRLMARHWHDGSLTLRAWSFACGLSEFAGGLVRPRRARFAMQRFAALLQHDQRQLEQSYLAELRAESHQKIDEAPFAELRRKAA